MKVIAFLLLACWIIPFILANSDTTQCHDDKCCIKRQKPNEQTGEGYLEYKASCLNGGLNCEQNTGCSLCRKEVKKGDKKDKNDVPVCSRFLDKNPKRPDEKCYDDDCCDKVKKDKYPKNEDELEYWKDCEKGGKDCHEKSGCRWCRKSAHHGDYKKPVCKKYEKDDDKPKKCKDDSCCEMIKKLKYPHEDDDLEYDKDCEKGGKGCEEKSGCRWCRKKYDHGDYSKPVCKKYDKDQDDKNKCYNEECCEKLKMEKYFHEDSELEYDEECHKGGKNCHDKTGCKWCRKGYNHEDHERPICKKYEKDEDDKEKKCHHDLCCEKLKKEEYYHHEDQLEYDKKCLKGGKGCERKTGCRWCTKYGDYKDKEKPICRKYKEEDDHDDHEDKKCYDNKCCRKLKENDYTYSKYDLEYDRECFRGGEHCVDYTGCGWCRRKEDKYNDLPICKKDLEDDDDDEYMKCHNDHCCQRIPRRGRGYLEFTPGCLWGKGEHCYRKTGCSWCTGLDYKHYHSHQPICKRFRHY